MSFVCVGSPVDTALHSQGSQHQIPQWRLVLWPQCGIHSGPWLHTCKRYKKRFFPTFSFLMSVVRTAWSRMVLVHVSWSELIHRRNFFSHFRSKTCHVISRYIPENKFYTSFDYEVLKTWANRKQNCWPTSPNIVGCYILRPCAHPVALCCVLLRVVPLS